MGSHPMWKLRVPDTLSCCPEQPGCQRPSPGNETLLTSDLGQEPVSRGKAGGESSGWGVAGAVQCPVQAVVASQGAGSVVLTGPALGRIWTMIS